MDISTPYDTLTSLLSRLWVAFTVEVDNCFEARMPHRTTRGPAGRGLWLVSHTMWWNCMRFVDDEGCTFQQLHALARTETNLNGMVRWGYVSVEPPAAGTAGKRPGKNWIVRATRRGMASRALWASLPDEVEQRWRMRIGTERLSDLKRVLSCIAERIEPGLPECPPILGYPLTVGTAPKDPPRASNASFQAQLAQVQLSLTYRYERESGESLAVNANLLRILSAQPQRVRDLPQLGGVSKEAVSAMMGALERRASIELMSGRGGRRVSLNERGLAAQQRYGQCMRRVEEHWAEELGVVETDRLRLALANLLANRDGVQLLQQAVTPPATGWRLTLAKRNCLPWQPMVLHRGGYPDGA